MPTWAYIVQLGVSITIIGLGMWRQHVRFQARVQKLAKSPEYVRVLDISPDLKSIERLMTLAVECGDYGTVNFFRRLQDNDIVFVVETASKVTFSSKSVGTSIAQSIDHYEAQLRDRVARAEKLMPKDKPADYREPAERKA